jgi:hypothetical protein
MSARIQAIDFLTTELIKPELRKRRNELQSKKKIKISWNGFGVKNSPLLKYGG